MINTMLTLFMAVTGGADWQDLMEPLANFSRVYVIGFVLYVTFLVFGLLNILTAMFVNSGANIAKVNSDLAVHEKMSHDKDVFRQLRRALLEANIDISGTISRNEFESKMQDPVFLTQLAVAGLNASEVLGLLPLLDIQDRGEVDVEELVYGLMHLKGNGKTVDLALMMYVNRRILAKVLMLERHVTENLAILIEERVDEDVDAEM
uniref:Ion transport domain-containing protein n=1 Tax=Pyrodinium bahamense TaxID=73915 RepID=A0A7S0BE35_9DINO